MASGGARARMSSADAPRPCTMTTTTRAPTSGAPAWRTGCPACGSSGGAVIRRLLDDEEADRALLPVAEAVVDEGELAGDVAHQLEAHAAARRHAPRLHAADRRARRGAEVHRVELLADDVEVRRVRRAGGHHPEAHAVANGDAD